MFIYNFTCHWNKSNLLALEMQSVKWNFVKSNLMWWKQLYNCKKFWLKMIQLTLASSSHFGSLLRNVQYQVDKSDIDCINYQHSTPKWTTELSLLFIISLTFKTKTHWSYNSDLSERGLALQTSTRVVAATHVINPSEPRLMKSTFNKKFFPKILILKIARQ